MKRVLSVFIFLLFVSLQPIQDYPLTKLGYPTSEGIQMYIKDNHLKFIDEYENLVHDTLYDVYISVDDLNSYEEDIEKVPLGYCVTGQGSSEIMITNRGEYFMGYEISMLSEEKRKTILEANNFVKGTIFHELTHYYFNQVIHEMITDSLYVSPEYKITYSVIYTSKDYGARFIEEGICTYVSIIIGECIHDGTCKPTSEIELTKNKDTYDILYHYSSEYVTIFLNEVGIKKGIQMIVSKHSPTIDELIYPEKYWNKIKKN